MAPPGIDFQPEADAIDFQGESYSADDVKIAPAAPPTGLTARRGGSAGILPPAPPTPWYVPKSISTTATGYGPGGPTGFQPTPGSGKAGEAATEATVAGRQAGQEQAAGLTGYPKIVSGLEKLPPAGTSYYQPPQSVPTTPEERRQQLKGATDVLHGSFEALTPLMGEELGARPLSLIRNLALATGASKGAGYAAKKAGLSPEATEAIETVPYLFPYGKGVKAFTDAVEPRFGVSVTPEGTGAAGTILGGRAGAGVSVTPEAVTVKGKVGAFEGTKTFTRGAAPKPALEPPTIEGHWTTQEIADAFGATNFAGPDEARAYALAARAAQVAPPEVSKPEQIQLGKITPSPVASARVERPRAQNPVAAIPSVQAVPEVIPAEKAPRIDFQPEEKGASSAGELANVLGAGKPADNDTAASDSAAVGFAQLKKIAGTSTPEKGTVVLLPDGRRGAVEYSAPADRLPVVRVRTEDGQNVRLTRQSEIDALKPPFCVVL